METFDWCPQIGPEGSYTYQTYSAQFGDGYKQEVGVGINNEVQSWPLEFEGNRAYIEPVRDFLRAHAGHKPFMWTPPMGEVGSYVAPAFQLRAIGYDAFLLSVTFEQRYTL